MLKLVLTSYTCPINKVKLNSEPYVHRPFELNPEVNQFCHSGKHERSIWSGDDRESAASPVLPGWSRALPVSRHSGKHVRLNLKGVEYSTTKCTKVPHLQKERFLKTGWDHADALDMMTVYSMLPQDDVVR